jgi:hypothetical protein
VDLAPDVVHLSNALISGVIPEIRRRLPKAKVVLQLQGDDIFLNAMPPAARAEIIAQIRLNTAQAAGWRKEANDQYFYWIAGVFFSLVSIIIFANTFTPKGSWSWNPSLEDIEGPSEVAQSEEEANEMRGEEVTPDLRFSLQSNYIK